MLKKIVILLSFCLTLVVALPFSALAEKQFTLVIDPGHGGKDAGAVGKKAKEKTINLNVALAFGKLVKEKCPEVKVIYTRTTDKFVALKERAAIANRNNADLFISIHTNAVPRGKKVYGTETFTLGTARAEENLEVAKRENSVITYEEDYAETYAGFDPNSPESYIIFEFMQDRYMEQSVDLARCIQEQYTSYAGRQNKGVKQAGFLVLRETSMPSVLTELGFISTPAEENYLNSERGQRQLAQSLYNGFATYYKKVTKHLGTKVAIAEKTEVDNTPAVDLQPAQAPVQEATPPAESVAPKKQVATNAKPVYKVQIFTSPTKVKSSDKRLKNVKKADFYKDGKTYKYTSGSSTNYNEINNLRRQLSKRFKGCFVVAFLNGERIDLNEARRLSK
ncbi:MAG: N-acetylmuramoyl-L-alanine amidase [Bacteroidaceae bacterium]|nr:N-acetylmuramoyl-L-alanine amidase [Bacteroidaceae bacterium]